MHNPVRIWPERIAQAKPDHLQRYQFASSVIPQLSVCFDAACGVGYGTAIPHHANINVTGIDISEEAINHAKKYFQTESGPQYICADIHNYKITADTLISFETIEHLENPQLFLLNCNVKNIISSVPNEHYYPFIPEVFKDDEYPHLRHYTPEQFDDVFTQIGFKVTHRFCQKDKNPGLITEGTDGRFIIYIATRL